MSPPPAQPPGAARPAPQRPAPGPSSARQPRTGWLPATPHAAAPGDPADQDDEPATPPIGRRMPPRPPAAPPPVQAPPSRFGDRPPSGAAAAAHPSQVPEPPKPAARSQPGRPAEPPPPAPGPWTIPPPVRARPAAQPPQPTEPPGIAEPGAPDQAGAWASAPAPSTEPERSDEPARPTPPVTPTGTAVARRFALPAVTDDEWDWDDGDGLADWDEIPLRESLPDRAAVDLPGSWRIGITSAFPYSGTTTLVGILGLVLAGARGESVLAIDLCPAVWPDEEPEEPRGDPLCPRVGLAGDVTVADVARRRDSPAAGLRALLHASGDTAPALEVVPLSRSQAPAAGGAAVVPADDTVTPGMLRTALGQLTRAYPLVLVDAPVAAPLSPTALRAADLIVVVSLAAPADLDRTAAALRDPAAPLLPVDKDGRRPPVIVAVVSPRRGRWSPRTRAAAGRLARHVDTIVRIPYESRLDPSKRAPIRIPRLRGSTRRSYLRLGVAVVESLLRLAAEETVKTHATAADATRGSTPETLRTPVV
ncbi:hypothetical protein [Pseudofrankia inefficax]|uniref:hypothetical protein n=1 Tax=Pseudofrankia inefficax (strain DSM 45817 / CECT 9037 / DDB 130130 / EuI1c) TaxID=298654 RepID=UPI0012FD6702|nr:hypothetical protein [Pseudofrankia inefficax]